MLFADATRTLNFKLAGAVSTTELALVGAWTQVDTTGHVQDASSFHLVSTGTTPVTIVASPAAGSIRKLQGLMLVNKDTAQATMIVFQDDGVDLRDAIRVTLDVGDNFLLRDDGCWSVINSMGAVKGTGPTGATGATGAAGGPGPAGVGSRGEAGASLLSGQGTPDAGDGADRDSYIDLVTGNIFVKGSPMFGVPASWTMTGNIRGPAGADGPAGTGGGGGLDIYDVTRFAGPWSIMS